MSGDRDSNYLVADEITTSLGVGLARGRPVEMEKRVEAITAQLIDEERKSRSDS